MWKRYLILSLVAGIWFAPVALSSPVPGDVFREYCWYNEKGDAGQALRVGGKQGQFHPDRGSAHGYINAPIELPHEFDLEDATKAEVVIEKILCHDGTQGLAIRVNNHEWIPVPECENIPEPQWEYQHHTYPTVPIPLDQLKKGKGNTFQMRVSPEHPWGWPQNLINGVHFRIYYDPAIKPYPMGHVVLSPEEGKNEQVLLKLKPDGPDSRIRRVDYIGCHEDLNLEGDGRYTQWHYYFFHGSISGHIGSALSAPWDVVWDMRWVPDQNQPIKVAARIMDETGIIFMTPSVELMLNHQGVSVELCKPYDIPKKWVTQSGEKTEHFDLQGDPREAVAMRLAWSSWSPGYMHGLYINDVKVFENEGPKYQYYAHRVTVADTSMLRKGQNTLKTGKTPQYDGKTVHGMEVNWPGIMVLVRYEGK
jgi:hypothetical protein